MGWTRTPLTLIAAASFLLAEAATALADMAPSPPPLPGKTAIADVAPPPSSPEIIGLSAIAVSAVVIAVVAGLSIWALFRMAAARKREDVDRAMGSAGSPGEQAGHNPEDDRSEHE
jgi:hypothetical protein